MTLGVLAAFADMTPGVLASFADSGCLFRSN